MRQPLTNEQIELALAAIMEALGITALRGWEDWSAYAAAGEWF